MALLSGRLSQVEKLDREVRQRSLEQLAAKRAEGAPYQEQLDASPASRRQRHHGNIYYRVYGTKDGLICVGCLSDPLRRRLADTLGLTDPRLDTGYYTDTPEAQAIGLDLEKKAEVLFREKTADEWLTLLEGRGIPAGPVRFVEELFDDPQIRANRLLTEVEHQDAGTVTTMGTMAKFSETPFEVELASPALGQHSEGILLGLGYSKDEIKGWREAGIVG
jgi:crotonobetainyl-CoA:carnitine CoA-transferase CaiB-like acyl-CoA transferase